MLMIDDRALVKRILDGDIQAFRLLINQHQRLVYHMIARLVKDRSEQEELCQDVFLRVHDRIGEFGFQSRLSTWIATIAYRQAINHMRKRRLPIVELPEHDAVTMSFSTMETPESIVAEEDLDKAVLKLADELPAQYKTILLLYHVENMAYGEIAEVTRMPEGTVKSYLFRARNLLKERVKRYFGEENL